MFPSLVIVGKKGATGAQVSSNMESDRKQENSLMETDVMPLLWNFWILMTNNLDVMGALALDSIL